MEKKDPIWWLNAPKEHNYPAAEDYLTLLLPKKIVADLIKKLMKVEIEYFLAKDIFRASGITNALTISNAHVQRNLEKIEKGIQLSSIILTKDVVHGRVIIADGFHRLCAVYICNEDARVPVKIVTIR